MDPEVGDQTNALTIVKKAPENFKKTLQNFRVIHDICVYGKYEVITPEISTKIDHCAVDFRHALNITTSLSSSVGDWCENASFLLDNLESLNEDSKEPVIFLSKQAKELSEGFGTIKDYCKDIAERLHEAANEAVKHNCFGKLEERINDAKKFLELQINEAKAKQENAQKLAIKNRKSADFWLTVSMVPIVGLGTISAALAKDTIASNTERQAHSAKLDLIKAEHEYSDKQEQQKEIKDLHDQFDSLLESLHEVELFCTQMQAFWDYESSKFNSVATNLKLLDKLAKTPLLKMRAQQISKDLKERQMDMEEYHKVMCVVNSSFQYVTHVKPKVLSITLPSFDLTFK